VVRTHLVSDGLKAKVLKNLSICLAIQNMGSTFGFPPEGSPCSRS
jgi:hypothetical protein